MPQFKPLRVPPRPPTPIPGARRMPGGGQRGSRGGCAAARQRADARCTSRPQAWHAGHTLLRPHLCFPITSSKNRRLHKGSSPSPGPQQHAPVSNPQPELIAISVPPICRRGSSASPYGSHRAVMGLATFPCHHDASDVPLCHPPSPLSAEEGERRLGRQRAKITVESQLEGKSPIAAGI